MTTSHAKAARATTTTSAVSHATLPSSHASLSPPAAALLTAPKRPVKRKKPTTLAPMPATALSPGRRNQIDADGGFALPSVVSRLPLEVVFLNRYRRMLRKHITLTGWDPIDADLKLLTTGRDGAEGRVKTLMLDECAHVTVEGIRAALPVLRHLVELRVRRCTALTTDLVAVVPVSLVEIDLGYCEWLDDNAVRLLARRCAALRKLSLSHCRRLTDYGVSAFADLTPTAAITELDVSLLPRVTDTCLLALLMRCTKLKTLTAASLSSMEGLNLQGLPRNSAPSLISLDFSRNARMHFLTVAHLVRLLHVDKLVQLDVSHCAQITDDTLVALGRYAPSLRELRMAFCIQLTDVGLKRLVEYVPTESKLLADYMEDDALRARCTRLVTLDLSGCYEITSAGISALAMHCNELETLLVDGLRRLDASGLDALASHCAHLHTLHWSGILIQAGPIDCSSGGSARQNGFFSVPAIDRVCLRAIRAMRSLHTLHIGSTKCDVDALASSLTTFGPQLRDLNVCSIANDVLCEALATHCSQLRTLRLSRSRYFSETAFLRVASACVNLRVLDLESCEQLQDQSLCMLAKRCPHLERLVLSNDWQVTDHGIAFLTQRCLALVRVQLRHCPEVSPQCLKAIAERNPLLVASKDGLEPKSPAVVAFLRLDREMDDAARKLTRWLRNCLSDRHHAKSAIDRALRHIRRRRRLAVRIQRCVRRWLAHKKHLQLVAQAQRAKDERVAANWSWVGAYCMLCRLLRRHLRKWLVQRHEMTFRRAEAEKERKRKAATDVQRAYRGLKGRQRASARREEVAAWHRLRHAKAQVIQRVWRGSRSRSRTKTLQLECWKRMLTTAKRIHVEIHSALQISRVSRGFVGRRRAHHRRAFLEEQKRRRERSARVIQRSLRAYFVRVMFRRRRVRGATAMQRVYRGFAGRRVARNTILKRSYAVKPVLLLLCARSVFTRDLAVAWKTKRDAGEKIAASLQNLYRGYYLGRLQRRLVLAAKRQYEYTLDASARCLQHFFRSIMILIRLTHLQALLRLRKRSATKIQSVWRMWLGKVQATAAVLRRDRRRRHAATLALLSSSIRSAPGSKDAAQAERLRLLQFGAVYLIVTTYRYSLHARGWQSPSLVRFVNRCATKIQSLVRGHQTRVFVAWYKQQMTWATRMVQRVWRGKMGRKEWRRMITERKLQQRLQEEEDRAARIAHKLTGQFVLDANSKYDKHAKLLQQWVRTLQRRQIFKQAQEVRDSAMRVKATDKLGVVLKMATESVVFQARVWRECMDNKQKLNEMEDSDVRALETEVATLKRACLEQYVAHATAATPYSELSRRKRDCVVVKKRLRDSTASMKETIQPFAEQAKKLTLESARVHVVNRQLQDELRRLKLSVTKFHEQLQAALPLEPLLYERDVERLTECMGLGGGKPSLLQEEVESAIAASSLNDGLARSTGLEC